MNPVSPVPLRHYARKACLLPLPVSRLSAEGTVSPSGHFFRYSEDAACRMTGTILLSLQNYRQGFLTSSLASPANLLKQASFPLGMSMLEPNSIVLWFR